MTGIADGRDREEREEHFRFAALAHPLRRRIMRLMLQGAELSAPAVAGKTESKPGTIAYHLRVLLRRRALRAHARGPALPAVYGWAAEANWVREMLSEGGEFGAQDP